MPQKTNLNTSPYYDDFDQNKNFYRVLFKPGYPIQSRELTTLQSLLQDQIETFGSHFFKEGSMVIPGGTTYDGEFYAVKLNSTHLGIDVSLYINKLLGKKIIGETSQASAVVRYILFEEESDEGFLTLYVKYLNSDSNFEINPFVDGETLITQDNITYGNTTILSGETFASTIDFNSTAIGSAVYIAEGVYFIRGHFVNISPQILVLDQYSNTPSYRIGLTITESIITAKDDNTLYDNAKGFSNYAAPGADRLQILTTLSKKELNDNEDDKDFIEVLRVINGSIKKIQDKSQFTFIKDYFAKRTYEESGNYSVTPFEVSLQNSLNDRVRSDGLFFENQFTEQNNSPNDNLLCVKVSPGKAYVKGFDIDNPSTVILDVQKPRSIETTDNQFVPFEMGNLLRVNNSFGIPSIGLNKNNYIYLQNQRKSSNIIGSGTTIGIARVYTDVLNNSAYANSASEWNLYLFDIQTYTELTVNQSLNSTECPTTSFIEGNSSNASGYVISDANSTKITLTQTSGNFIVGERIKINGTEEYSRIITSVKSYNVDDIKSIHQPISVSGLSTSFTADSVLERQIANNFSINDRLSINSSGIATCPGRSFVGIKSDTIIRYQRAGLTTETYNRVLRVDSTGKTLFLAGVSTVFGVCDGSLPSSTENVTFSLGLPTLRNEVDSSLYIELPNKNVSDVDLSESDLVIQKQISGTSSSTGSLTINTSSVGLSSSFFENFGVTRYSVVYNDGVIEDLTSDQFIVSPDSQSFTINGLRSTQGLIVNATLRKFGIKNKKKIYTRSKKVVVDKTRSGLSTSFSGLTYNQYYGLRVEDKEISLKVADVNDVIAVYESLDENAPVLDGLTFVSSLNLSSNAILGENVRGETSGAIAQIVTNQSSSYIEIVYLNSNKFIVGENVTFLDSNITGILQDVTVGQYIDRTQSYTLNKGQKEQYYDYSSLTKITSESISRQLLIIFNYYTVSTNDDGDVYTVKSYDANRFNYDVPLLRNNLRATDTLDFRPRVSEFTSSSSSPFAFTSKNFSADSNNTTIVVSPNESSLIKHSYYLPRIDKLVLNKDGEFKILLGNPSLSPKEPNNIEDSMPIAVIELPAYLYNPRDAKIRLIDNKRFTMRDIGSIENRVSNLERTTTLSFLELDTKTLQIQDTDGLSRFKNGFFVDPFKNFDLMDAENVDLRCAIDSENSELITNVDSFSIKPQLVPAENVDISTLDFTNSNFNLVDTNVKKTGDLITLNYSEVEWITQPIATRVENVNPFNIVEYAGNLKLNPSSDSWTREVILNNGATRFTWGGFNGSYIENVLVNTGQDIFMRSRNVEFTSFSNKPLTRYYAFLDKNSSIDIIPKLLEVTMTSGQFQVGEIVDGYNGPNKIISFRVAQQNHKSGAYNAPSKIYTSNPYNTSSTLSGYTPSSTVINIDTAALAQEVNGNLSGYVVGNTVLVGRTSKAQARVSPEIRLITDSIGDVAGCFFIRDPNVSPPAPVRILTGSKTFKISTSLIDAALLPQGFTTSNAEATYTANGTLRYLEAITVTVRIPPPPPPPPRGDPLAQTFTTDKDGGFLTSVDIYLYTKDTVEPLTVEVRTVELGTPTNQLVQDFAQVVLSPDEVQVSTLSQSTYQFKSMVGFDDSPGFAGGFGQKDYDAAKNQGFNDSDIRNYLEKIYVGRIGPEVQRLLDNPTWGRPPTSSTTLSLVPTRVTFPSPIYLEPDTEYALVLRTPTSDQYNAWIARMGEKSVLTSNLPSVENVIYSRQYTGGSLFKSQNGTIWTENQFEDLTFKLYKAQFVSQSGTVYFNNPSLYESSLDTEFNGRNIVNNPITTYPRKLSVGINTTTGLSSIINIGRKLGVGNTVTGIVEYAGGNLSGVTTTNTGIGYSNGTFSNVPLYNIFGNGKNATATVVVSNGSVSTVSIANSGTGYGRGDILGITTSYVSKGSGATFSVTSNFGIDTLYLTNVKGEKFAVGETLVYYNGGTAVSLAGTTVRIDSEAYDRLHYGNIIEVYQYSHGMHADNNLVMISGVKPNTSPLPLINNLGISTSTISIADTSSYASFEGIQVSAANTGYVLINNEIIGYESVGNGSLNVSQRGVDNTINREHFIGDLVYKYECNGISLRRINKTHEMGTFDSDINARKTIDTYLIEIDTNPRSTGVNQLSFDDQKTLGGDSCVISQNIQFNTITPYLNIITPGRTNVVSQIRTVSATSADGNEVSFEDQGYEFIELNQINRLKTTRMICSKINETNRLTTLPRNKSFTLSIDLNSPNTNISPVIDTRESANIIFGRNRLNSPVEDYINDPSANLLTNDPHSSIYISKRIDLKQPASCLKVFIDAYRPQSSDFRVLYKLFKSDSSEITQSYQLFPGYDNMIDIDGDGFGDIAIDVSKNNGKSDAIVRESKDGEFIEYQFTADDLDQFTGFSIKIVMTGENEADSPRFKNLRVMALS